MRRSPPAWICLVLAGFLLAACSDQRRSTETPHPLGKKWLDSQSAEFHGKDSVLSSLDCSDCHKLAVKCFECHFGPDGSKVPKNVTWTHGSVPHDFLTPYAAVCNRCHSVTGAFPDLKCTSACHAEANHPLGRPWLDKKAEGFHGDVADDNATSCRPCHGSDYQGGFTGVGCFTCHFSPDGNKSPNGPAHVAFSGHWDFNQSFAVCNACHETNVQYGNASPTVHCAVACHADANHPLGQAWLDKKVSGYHGDAAKANSASCQACHGADYQGGVTGVGCFTCHFSPQGNKSPDGAAHVVFDGHWDFAQSYAVCNACHQTNRQYGNASPTVTCAVACHSSDANHPLGQAWLDKKVAGYHGEAAAANVTACQVCHGADYQGGFTGVGCLTCHFSPQGNKSPNGAAHVAFDGHWDFAQSYAVCNACHQTNLLYGNTSPSVNCSLACHAQHTMGRTWMDKSLASYHGAVVNEKGTTSCTVCHGSDLQGGSPGLSSCYECHFSPAGNKSPTGAAHVAFDGHWDFNQSYAVCNACHRTNRQYGQASPSVTCAVACHEN